jgi:hypothetical protein
MVAYAIASLAKSSQFLYKQTKQSLKSRYLFIPILPTKVIFIDSQKEIYLAQRGLTPMSYSEFKTIAQVQEKFGLTVKESENLFVDIQPLTISDYLQQTLKRNLSIANAINTEKARSELLIAPILLEIRHIFHEQVGFFSGTEFNIRSEIPLPRRPRKQEGMKATSK